MFSLISVVDDDNGIVKNGSIPWDCSNSIKHFEKITKGHVVIMGSKTWKINNKPFCNRFNVVISSSIPNTLQKNKKPDIIFNSIEKCLEYFSSPQILNTTHKNQKLFVIGGDSIYEQFLKYNLIGDLHIITVSGNYECDKFIKLPKNIFSSKVIVCNSNSDICKKKHISTYQVSHIINHEENKFIDVIREVLSHGVERGDRTGIGNLSIFGRELRFDLSMGCIPMSTTRPVSLRIVFEELMWILRGQTNNKILNDKKINIWNPNTTRSFLDNKNLEHLPEGDIGASYGFQMRHFGETYNNCEDKYKGGFDQLSYVIKLLKNNPDSRRIIMNLWNPVDLDKMALPPCVYSYQFYVANGLLSLKLVQRSSDIVLAGSHNCTAGALLVRMLCKCTGLKPGELIWSPADIHIYKNQIKSVEQQLIRIARPYPMLKIDNTPNSILEFEYKDLILLNYFPHKRIKFAMNA
jgi:thymidylate synthase